MGHCCLCSCPCVCVRRGGDNVASVGVHVYVFGGVNVASDHVNVYVGRGNCCLCSFPCACVRKGGLNVASVYLNIYVLGEGQCWLCSCPCVLMFGVNVNRVHVLGRSRLPQVMSMNLGEEGQCCQVNMWGGGNVACAHVHVLGR